MKRAKPRQHKRRLPTGRRITINKGVSKRHNKRRARDRLAVHNRKEFDELSEGGDGQFLFKLAKKNYGFLPVKKKRDNLDLIDGLTITEIEDTPIHRRTDRQHKAIEVLNYGSSPFRRKKNYGFVKGVEHLRKGKTNKFAVAIEDALDQAESSDKEIANLATQELSDLKENNPAFYTKVVRNKLRDDFIKKLGAM